MNAIFDPLHALHPLLPALYVLLLVFGAGAPSIYVLVRKMPYDITLIWKNARQGDAFARVVIALYATLVVASTIIVLAIVAKRWLR